MWLAIAALFFLVYLPGTLIFRLPVADRPRRAALSAEERAFWSFVSGAVLVSAVGLALASIGQFGLGQIGLVTSAVAIGIGGTFRGRLLFSREATAPTRTLLVPLVLMAGAAWYYLPASEYVLGASSTGTYLNAALLTSKTGSLAPIDPVAAAVPAAAQDLVFPRDPANGFRRIRFDGFTFLTKESFRVVASIPHLFPLWAGIGNELGGLTGARDAAGATAILGLLAVYFAASRTAGGLAAAAAAGLLAGNIAQVWAARYPNAAAATQFLVFAGLLAFARSHVDAIPFFSPLAGFLLGLVPFTQLDAGPLLLLLMAAIAIDCVVRRRKPQVEFLLPLVITLAAGLLYRAAIGLPFWAHETALVAGRAADATRVSEFANIGWAYATIPGAVAAIVGCILMLRRSWRTSAAFLVTGTVWTLLIAAEDSAGMGGQAAIADRYVPVALPFTMIAIGAAAFGRWFAGEAAPGRWTSGPTRPPVTYAVPALLVLMLAAHYGRIAGPLWAGNASRGSLDRLQVFVRHTSERDLVILEASGSSDIHALGPPLADVYNRTVLALSTRDPDLNRFAELVEWGRAQYDRIVFVGGNDTNLMSGSVAVAGIEDVRIELSDYDSIASTDRRFGHRYAFDGGIYRLIEPPADSGWFALDVGTLDDLHVSGMYQKEGRQPTFRWTQEFSSVRVPGLKPDSARVTLWLSDGGRPANAPRAHLVVYLEDAKLGEGEIAGPFKPYTFVIPPASAARLAAAAIPARLKIVTTTWSPSMVLGIPDNRVLGVMLDRVEVR